MVSLKARRQNEDRDATSEGEKVRAPNHDHGGRGGGTLLILLKATGSSRGGFSKVKVCTKIATGRTYKGPDRPI